MYILSAPGRRISRVCRGTKTGDVPLPQLALMMAMIDSSCVCLLFCEARR